MGVAVMMINAAYNNMRFLFIFTNYIHFEKIGRVVYKKQSNQTNKAKKNKAKQTKQKKTKQNKPK